MSAEVNGELIPSDGSEPIPLIGERLIVGRRATCDIPLPFSNVSAIHCELSFRGGRWSIRDLNSTNGIKVNGTHVQQKVLDSGDEITVAKKHWTILYVPP